MSPFSPLCCDWLQFEAPNLTEYPDNAYGALYVTVTEWMTGARFPIGKFLSTKSRPAVEATQPSTGCSFYPRTGQGSFIAQKAAGTSQDNNRFRGQSKKKRTVLSVNTRIFPGLPNEQDGL
jgi:hypothetical protein